MRALLTLLAVAVAIVVGAIVVLPRLVPEDLVKRQVEAAVTASTGRTLTIAGEVSIGLWPGLGATLGDVSLANADGASNPVMAGARELRANLALWPLLAGDIRVTEFVLYEPAIDLEVLPDGTPNWRFRPPAADAGGGAPDASRGGQGFSPSDVAVADLRIVGGQVRYADRRSGRSLAFSDVDLALSLPSLDQPMTMTGALSWNGERVEVEAHLARPRALMQGGSTGLDLDLSAAPINLTYSGDASFGDMIATDGEVTLDVPSVRELAAWAETPLAAGGGFGPLTLSGMLSSKGQRYTFSQARLSLDGSNATGEVTVATSGTRPKVTGKLAVDQIDANVYLGEGDSGWSTEEIDFSPLRAIDADLDLAADEIVFGNIETGAAVLALTIENGRLAAKLTDLALYGGTGRGTLVLDGATPTPAIAADFVLTGLAIDPFLTAAMGFEQLRGSGALTVNVTARGASEAALVRTLNGTGAIDFRDGAIKGINLAQIVRSALTDPILGWQHGAARQTDFSELKGTFRIRDGVVTNDDLTLSSPLLRLTGAGSTSIPERSIDYRLRPVVVATLEGQGGAARTDGVTLPVRVSGTWTAPRFAPDAEAVLENPQQTIEEIRRLEKLQPKDVIRGLLGEPSSGENAPSNGENGPAPEKNETDTEQLLRGLFGR